MKREPTPEECDQYLDIYKQYVEESKILNHNKYLLERSYPKVLTIFIVLISVFAYLISNKWYSIFIAGYFVLIAYEPIRNLLINLTSSGKYKIVKKQIEDLKESTKAKVLSFEDVYKSYLEENLKKFYEEKLFRKRSGTDQFESAVSDFAIMLEEAKAINNVFLTKRIGLKDYEKYLIGRMGMSLFQKKHTESKLNNYTKELVSIKKTGSVITAHVKIVPPEAYYSTPRHIDWELINKNKKITGDHGEEIVLAIERNYLMSVSRSDLAEKVHHSSKEEGDGSGYDIMSFYKDGKEKYIEVKSTKSITPVPFYISRNELDFLSKNQENTYLYRISNVHENTIDPIIKVYSASDVINSNQIIPVQYLVNMN